MLAIVSSITSCSSDNDAITGSENLNCISPTGLTAVKVGTNVGITWTAVGEETTWEIQFGPTGFAVYQGTTVTATTNPFMLSGLTPGTAYDIYVRSLCSDSEHSVWVGPISVTTGGTAPTTPVDPTNPTNPPTGNFDFMNVNVKGQQYNNIKPFTYPLGNATSVVNFEQSEEIDYLRLMGDSGMPIENGTFEINLYIPTSQWVPGTYVLHSKIGANFDGSESMVEFIATEEYANQVVITNGTMTITEFNLTTRRIKGTFSFDFTVTDSQGNITGPHHASGGTFDYPLDSPHFD